MGRKDAGMPISGIVGVLSGECPRFDRGRWVRSRNALRIPTQPRGRFAPKNLRAMVRPAKGVLPAEWALRKRCGRDG